MISGAEISPDSSQIDGHYVKVCHSVGPSALFLALWRQRRRQWPPPCRRRVLLDARSRTRLFCIFIFNARPLIRARFIRFNGMLFGQLSDYSALRTLAVFLSVDVSQETLPLN
jgi:hypothetical protein